MKLVVAGNYGEFKRWCNENKINLHDPREVKWIRNRIDMLGFNDVEVIFYGTWYKLKEAHEIEYEAKRMKVFQKGPNYET